MKSSVSRRNLIRAGVTGAGLFALSRLSPAGFCEETAGDDEVVAFLDKQPIDPKRPMLKWEDLREWITPQDEFFAVSHYGDAHVSADSWRLKIEGLVERPMELSLEQLQSRPKTQVTATLECSGNGAGPGFMGAIGNARWAGTALAPLLKECGVRSDAIQAAFWGADSGKEKIRNKEYEQNFARALSLEQALRDDVILAWEMNGKPLAVGHGYPLRLIVPGWYGIAWVKWLTRIELRDRQLMNRFMARDYVTIRGEKHGDAIEWKETSVGPLNVKSLVGRVTRRKDGSLRITGAAWAEFPVTGVELKIDDGPWVQTQLDQSHRAEPAWTFWSFDWKNPPPGEHTLVSRAIDAKGHVQPGADDDAIKLKQTYWEANQQYPRRIRVG